MKNILIGIGLFLAGGGVGFLISKKMLEKTYAELAQEEIDSVKEALWKHNKKVEEAALKVSELSNSRDATNDYSLFVREQNPYEAEKAKYDALFHNTQTEIKSSKQSSFSEISNDPHALSYTPPFDEGEDTTDDEDSDTSLAPYVITAEEFTDEQLHHDKVTLYYYVEDDTLCDDQEQLIYDVDHMCGRDCLAGLDTETAVWARNEALAIDFEILKVNQSYAETVMGVIPKEPVTRLRRLRERDD